MQHLAYVVNKDDAQGFLAGLQCLPARKDLCCFLLVLRNVTDQQRSLLIMEAPSWMFTKALSHRQKVLRLFKRSMRQVDAWYGGDALEQRYHKVLLRARFDVNKDETDSRKSKKMVIDGCRELWEKRHPTPLAFQFDPYGVAYERDPPLPDNILDNWTYVEKEMFPYYFNTREVRKKELLEQWEKIDESWDRELLAIQRKPPSEKQQSSKP